MATRQLLVNLLVVFLLAIPLAKLNMIELTKCNCIKRDDTPTRQQLTLLVVRDRDLNISLRIKDGISTDCYDDLGTFLLNDETGDIMQKINRDYRLSKQRIDEIFDRWIRGEGQHGVMKSNTWQMLVECLGHVKLKALADKIDSVLKFCSNENMNLDKKCVVASMKNTDFFLSVIVATAVIFGTAVITVVILLFYKGRDSKYTAYLKYRYKNSIQDSYLNGGSMWPPLINTVFPLAMRMRSGDNDFMQNNILQYLEDVFIGDKPRMLLLLGDPGSGKSTLSHHICHQWREGRLLKKFRYVILVKLCEKTVQLAQKIADILPKENETMGADGEKAITNCNGNDVLLVFDGWFDLPESCSGYNLIMDILKGENLKLKGSSIVVTSRPCTNNTCQLVNIINTQVEILGFRKPDVVQNYFSNCLNQQHLVNKLLNRMQEIPAVEGSYCLPSTASILVHVFKCECNLPMSDYEIFYKFIINCIKKKHKIELKSLCDLPPDIKNEFKYFCEVAHKGVTDGTLHFSNGELHHNWNSLGLLYGVKGFAKRESSASFSFIHVGVHQLLSAIYLATELTEHKQVEYFKAHFFKPAFNGIFRYYASYTKLKTAGIKDFMSYAVTSRLREPQEHGDDPASRNSIFVYTPQSILLSIIHCLYHGSNKDLYNSVAMQLEQRLDLCYIHLNLNDCQSVGSFLSYCLNFGVHLEGCSIGDIGCKMLFRMKLDLRILSLKSNAIGDNGAISIAEGTKTMRNLEELHLSDNSIGAKGAKAISDAMVTMTSLKRLTLWKNSIGNEGAEAISEAMINMSTTLNLKELSLVNNSIGDEGAKAIASMAIKCTSLTWIDLRYNDAIGEIGKTTLKEAAENSNALIDLQ